MNYCNCGCIPQPHTHTVTAPTPQSGWDVAAKTVGGLVVAVVTALVVDAAKEGVKALLKA